MCVFFFFLHLALASRCRYWISCRSFWKVFQGLWRVLDIRPAACWHRKVRTGLPKRSQLSKVFWRYRGAENKKVGIHSYVFFSTSIFLVEVLIFNETCDPIRLHWWKDEFQVEHVKGLKKSTENFSLVSRFVDPVPVLNICEITLLRVIPTMTCWVEVVRWGLSLRIWWEEWRISKHWFQVSLA